MSDPDPDTPPDQPPAKIKGGHKRRSLSFGTGLKPKVSSSDGNKSDSGSLSGNGQGRVRGFFASFSGSKKKTSDNSLSSNGKTTTSSDTSISKTADVPSAIAGGPPPSRSDSSLRLSTILQGGSELMEKSVSSRTETGVQPVDPFRLAVVNAENAIDKLQTAYTVLSSLAQMTSVAQELLPGVGAAVGIVANMVKSAKTVAVNRVAALRLVSHASDGTSAKPRWNDARRSCWPYSKP